MVLPQIRSDVLDPRGKFLCVENSENCLKTHKRTHSCEQPHRCTMCEFSSITTGDLKVHMMRKHTGEKPFKCNQCNFTCASSGNLQRHMRTHTGEKPFRCNKCSKAYKEKRNLTKYFRIHITSDYVILILKYKMTL